MSKLLLLDEQPLLVMPQLAKEIGLNEAIILQQIHYWIKSPKSGVIINDEKWVYNSVVQWNEQFPFWSANTIRRALNNLREKGYLIAEKLSKDARDNTLYYRIDYSKTHEQMHLPKMGKPDTQNGQITNNTETTTETTHHIADKSADSAVPAKAIHDLYNEVCTRLPKSRGLTPKRRSQIQARWKEESERQSLSWWKSFFEYVNQSDFLANGSNGWKGANLEWLTNPNNMVKVIEGQYENE